MCHLNEPVKRRPKDGTLRYKVVDVYDRLTNTYRSPCDFPNRIAFQVGATLVADRTRETIQHSEIGYHGLHVCRSKTAARKLHGCFYQCFPPSGAILVVRCYGFIAAGKADKCANNPKYNIDGIDVHETWERCEIIEEVEI